MKTCSRCKETKPVEAFGKHKSAKDGIRASCKLCVNKAQKENSDPVKNKERLKKWAEENPEKEKSRKANWFAKNPEYRKNWVKQSRLDPLVKAKDGIRALIGICLRNGGYTKKTKTEAILGCSFDEFKLHIESQFQDGMTWENRKQWHIDHKIPASWAKSEEELLKLNHYSNLQPLWANENLAKSNRFAS